MFARRTPRLVPTAGPRGRGGARAGGRPRRPGRRHEQQPVPGTRREGHLHGGHPGRHRLGQPVHGHRGRGLRDLPDGVPHAHGVLRDRLLPVPGLAESWQESADKKTWTYKIRSGLTWSDGKPLTAKDAAYTFNRVINGEYERTNYGSYVENITKAEAPDDTTLVLTVSKPSPIMEKLYVYILPEHIWEKIDEKAVKSYKNEGTAASPTVGWRPLRDGRAQGRPVHPHAGQPQLLRRQARGRRGRVQDLQERRRARPGAEEGRDRLRRRPRGERVQVAGEHARHHRRLGGLLRLRRDRLQHRRSARRRHRRSATATRCSRT